MKYVNPSHPVGVLYPQSIGALRGGWSNKDVARSRAACMSPDDKDPVYAATRRAEVEEFVEMMRRRS